MSLDQTKTEKKSSFKYACRRVIYDKAKVAADKISNINSHLLKLPFQSVIVKKIMPPIKIKTAQAWFTEIALFPDAKIKRMRGIRVPITGITLDTVPIFKALNIKYAPIVQAHVENEAIAKTSNVGTFVKGIAKIARKENKLI